MKLLDVATNSIEVGWDKIVLGLIGVVAAMGTTLGLVIKKLLGPNKERDKERAALLEHLQKQADKSDRHHAEILEQQDRHHTEREQSRRESMAQMASVMEARHAEVLQSIETLRSDVTRMVATIIDKVTSVHDSVAKAASRDSDWRHFLNNTLLKIASAVASDKAKTPEDVLRILQVMLDAQRQGDREASMHTPLGLPSHRNGGREL